MNSIDLYFKKILDILREALAREKENMEKAAKLIAEANKNKRSVFAFGCNHAGLIALELFYRTGGLVTVNPVRVPGMMLEVSPITMSSRMERMENYGKIIFEGMPAKKGDVLFIHSVSGRNNVTIDLAENARRAGLKIIVLSNLKTAEKVISRHPSGKKLHDFADILIDNCGDEGDAAIRLDGFKQKVAPTSTAVGAAIMNAVICRAAELLLDEGIQPPVFMSGNIDGGDEFNQKVISEHRENIFYM